jgi:thiosulfate dehydrogenase [quinone] large subunit
MATTRDRQRFGAHPRSRRGDQALASVTAVQRLRRRLAVVPVGWMLLPLRLFLGATFVYAGLQKFADPNFFDPQSPTSIVAQLRATSHSSPIGSQLVQLIPHATLVGVGIAAAELAVGLGVLLGLWTRLAALGGALLALGFLLAVSWHSDPYYLGPDIVFLFAWTPLIIAGSGGVLAVDAAIRDRVRQENGLVAETVVPVYFETVQGLCGSYRSGWCERTNRRCDHRDCPVLGQARTMTDPPDVEKRAFIRTVTAAAAVAAGALVLGGGAAGIGRLVGGTDGEPDTASDAGGGIDASAGSPTTVGSPAPSEPGGGAAGTTTAPTLAPAAPAGGRLLGTASSVPTGGAATFIDAKTGDEVVVVQATAGTFTGFDGACTHDGCPVDYAAASHKLVCPCHGAEFDLAGRVQRGPARRPLSTVKVALAADGNLYRI